MVLSPDGKVLASATTDGVVQLWDPKRGRERCDPIELGTQEVQLALSPDGKILATLPVGSSSNSLRLWDTGTRRELDHLAGEPVDARALVFTPDGRSLATAGGPPTVFGLDAKRPLRTFKSSRSVARSMAVSPEGSTIATAGTDGVVTIWDVPVGVPFATLKGPARPVLSVAFSPDGKTLASSGVDRTVRLWDVASWTERATIRGPIVPITALAFAPDSTRLASSCDGDPTVSLWDVAQGRLAATLTLPGASAGDGVSGLAFDPDGKTLYTAGEHGIEAWDVTPASRALVLATASSPGQEQATLRGHADVVRSLAVFDNGKALATRASDGTIKVWDVGKGRGD